MSLKETIDKDYIASYKAHDDVTVSVLRLIKSSIKNQEIALGHDLSDDEIVRLLRKEVKQRQDAIAEYQKGGRDDLAKANEKEIVIIDEYLPAQLDPAKVQAVVTELISELNATGPADIGKVIGASMQKLGAQADGAVVSEIVRNSLSKK